MGGRPVWNSGRWCSRRKDGTRSYGQPGYGQPLGHLTARQPPPLGRWRRLVPRNRAARPRRLVGGSLLLGSIRSMMGRRQPSAFGGDSGASWQRRRRRRRLARQRDQRHRSAGSGATTFGRSRQLPTGLRRRHDDIMTTWDSDGFDVRVATAIRLNNLV
jgi:hypothetical protein